MVKFSSDDLPETWNVENYNYKESEFSKLFKSKWDQIHNESEVFRYRTTNLLMKMVGNKYLLQLNPDRAAKRRYPEEIKNICQSFDPDMFNFTKVSPQEIMFDLVQEDDGVDVHKVLVNVSPISRYHSLLCPSLDKCLPQVATKQSLILAIEIMFLSQDRNLRIGFNSLCALASVNHLHYHLFIEKNVLPVEEIKCLHLKGPVYYFENAYPIQAFCFQVKNKTSIESASEVIFKLIQFFLVKNVAHNLIMTKGKDLEGGKEEVLRIIVWPRRSSYGVKQLTAFNVAVCELSGWFPVYNAEDFGNLQIDDIENELRKWKVENFEELCEEIKSVY